MSNNPTNREQDALFEQTPTQLNPGAAHPADFKIEDRGPGQCGETPAERAKLVGEQADKPLPVRNEIPHTRYPD
jgi:hypothetical protein